MNGGKWEFVFPRSGTILNKFSGFCQLGIITSSIQNTYQNNELAPISLLIQPVQRIAYQYTLPLHGEQSFKPQAL
jgi:hypothetical protein